MRSWLYPKYLEKAQEIKVCKSQFISLLLGVISMFQLRRQSAEVCLLKTEALEAE